AKNAEVSELWLTHYSPSLVRPEDYLNDTRAIFNNTKAGKDGKSVTLQFDPKE
ncbi:MAG: rnz, partial [Anaerocolumna sp.]|nr:rnz [Anaerocolumna sp.]